MSHKILFFGNERLATGISTTAPALQALIAHGYEVAAVVVAQNQTGVSRQARELEVAAVARDHGIPLLAPAELHSVREELAAYEAAAGLLIAFGKIVPRSLLELFPAGIINLHPSLLPLHRGPTPIESVILEGAQATGVSLMRLDQKVDTGPLYAQEKIQLTGQETKQILADRLLALGTELLIHTLPAILDGSLAATPQDDTDRVVSDQQITKADSRLDWTKPAIRLEREVRAYAGWPRSQTTLGTTAVIITEAHIISGSGAPPGNLWQEKPKQLGVYTADGILAIDRLIPLGKREMPIAAFLAGYKL